MNGEFPGKPGEEFEVKLTALLMGQLSEQEAAAVRARLDVEPELADLYERLRRAAELLREASAIPEPVANAEPVRLSPEKRARLLEHFHGEKQPPPSELPARRDWKWLIPMGVAAGLTALIGGFGVLSLTGKLAAPRGEFAASEIAVMGAPKAAPQSADLPTPERRSSGFAEEGLAFAPQKRFSRSLSADAPSVADPDRDGVVPREEWSGRKLTAPRSSTESEMRSSRGRDARPLDRVEAFSSESSGAAPTPRPQSLAKAVEKNDAVEPYALLLGDEVAPASRKQPELPALSMNFRSQGAPVPPPAPTTAPVTAGEDWLDAAPTNAAPQAGDKALGVAPENSRAFFDSAGISQAGGLGGAPAGSGPSTTSTSPERFAKNERMGRDPSADAAKRQNVAPSAPEPPAAPEATEAKPAKPIATTPISGLKRELKEEVSKLQEVARETAQLAIQTKTSEKAPAEPQAAPADGEVALAPRVESARPDMEMVLKQVDQAKEGGEARDTFAYAPKMVRDEFEKLVKEQDDDKAVAPATPAAPAVPQPEIATAENPFSTFSLNVSDVSFKLAGASLEQGKMPEPAGIRTEEFINAFDYRDPLPVGDARIAFASERARYPFAHNRDLLRLSVKTAAAGRIPGRPLNLVLLLDNSGSMERADRVAILREALRVLATQVQPQDKLSVITFARTPRVWASGVSGENAGELAERIMEVTPQGGTNLAAALDLGYETARRYYTENSINRLVLLTDGAANLGQVDPDTLRGKVERHRKEGIALDCFGIGWEGYNDDLLEALARNGDGRYGFINRPEDAATEFAAQLAGALKVAASDVKVQVEFNPKRVKAYRQLGYAKHQLTKEQFRDNTVDAAEIGAAESGTALYAIEVNPQGEGELGTARVRYKVPGTNEYEEKEWTLSYQAPAPAFENANPSLRLAGTAAAFAEWLAGSPFAAEVSPDRLLGYLNGVADAYGSDPRPKRLEWMIRQAQSISGR